MEKFFPALWAVIKNLVLLVILGWSYGNAYSNFEIVIVTMLWLIFTTIFMFSSRWTVAQSANASANMLTFGHLRKVLKDEEYLLGEEKVEEKLKKETGILLVVHYINDGARIIIWLTMLYKIFLFL